MMKCPKCEFEQIVDSPDECAKCGILFEKWQERQDADAALAEQHFAPAEQSPEQFSSTPLGANNNSMAAATGGTLCQIGLLMITLPILSFVINLVGYEFILLMPLEYFDNPTHAKFWMVGIGIVLAGCGAAMGGEVPE